MANPANDVVKTATRLNTDTRHTDVNHLLGLFKDLNSLTRSKVVITEKDPLYNDTYKVDVFYNMPVHPQAQKKDFKAYATRPTDYFTPGDLVEAYYHPSGVYLLDPDQIGYLYVTRDWGVSNSGYIIGNVTDHSGQQPLTDDFEPYPEVAINLNFNDSTLSFCATTAGTRVPFLRSRRIAPFTDADDTSKKLCDIGYAIFGTFIPRPFEMYSVLTPIDDTLIPVWTSLRWMQGVG